MERSSAPVGPLDELGRGVPRATVTGYRDATEARDWERAAEYLDLRNLPEDVQALGGAELARRLRIVLERGLWFDFASLSDRPEGHAGDGLPAYRDRVGVIDTPEGAIEVLLQRVPRGDGERIWKFSNKTLAQMETLWAHHGYGPLAERLVRVVPDASFLGLELWQWAAMLVLALGAFVGAWLLTAIAARAVRPVASGEALERLIAGPVRLLLFVVLLRGEIDLLAPSLEFRALVDARTLPYGRSSPRSPGDWT